MLPPPIPPVRRRAILPTVLLALMFCGASLVGAAMTPEKRCQASQLEAAAKYSACQQKALGRYAGGDYFEDVFKYVARVAKCQTKYVAIWPKLAAKAAGTGSSCDAPRFVLNASGTITDNLTRLQWEMKSDDMGVHDQDDKYFFAQSPSVGAAASFLAALNDSCYGDHCDWRLPTLAELQTIVSDPYPFCETNPCIDPIFGPTIGGAYWTSTLDYAGPTGVAGPAKTWLIQFSAGIPTQDNNATVHYVRAVRAGF